MLKRIFDLFFSVLGIVFLFPVFIIVGILIKLDSRGPIIYKQERVTKNGKLFKIYKFRTMIIGAEKEGTITVGKDNRITKLGKFLRKSKLDELPQLFNVMIGDMSFVGPRPEVPKYVSMYTEEQREILKVKAGITDYASIYFSNESEIIGERENPEQFFIEKIMPYKIELNKKYISEISLYTDVKIIIMTILKLLGFLKNNNNEGF